MNREHRRAVAPAAAPMTATGGVDQQDARNDMTRFGFGGRLQAAFPSQVLMDITEVCNLECVHCPHPDFKQSSHYGGRHLDPALNIVYNNL